jgi:hypothetical protein
MFYNAGLRRRARSPSNQVFCVFQDLIKTCKCCSLKSTYIYLHSQRIVSIVLVLRKEPFVSLLRVTRFKHPPFCFYLLRYFAAQFVRT